MVSLLKIDLVQYRCSCDVWQPPCQLYFCRKCDLLKCALCAHEQLDIVFCPNCMEGNSDSSTAPQRSKWRCKNCVCCPMCDNTLVIRGLANGTCYAVCTACHWTTRDAGLPDALAEASASWPDHQHGDAARLEAVALWMRDFVACAKTERERRQQRSKRLSNLGTLSNDRYGLSNAYSKRQRALNNTAAGRAAATVCRAEESIPPTADVPDLDSSVFTTAVTVGDYPPTLDQILRQPLRGAGAAALPSRRRLISRHFYRCNEHDTLLYRGELNCYAVKPKIACFAVEIVPELRISRAVELTTGQPFSIFMVISNNSLTSVEVTLRGVEPPSPADPRFVDCSNFQSTFCIPNRDNVADIDELFQSPSSTAAELDSGAVVMIKRHRCGIRVDCKPLYVIGDGDAAPYAHFRLTYSYPDETPNKRLDLDVRVSLDQPARAVRT